MCIIAHAGPPAHVGGSPSRIVAHIYRSVAPQRFNTILLGMFSGLAPLLATTGISGVLSYSISRRTADLGLRVALGASSRGILRMTIAQGMRPVLAGLALGAWCLSRYFTAPLFGVNHLTCLRTSQ